MLHSSPLFWGEGWMELKVAVQILKFNFFSTKTYTKNTCRTFSESP